MPLEKSIVQKQSRLYVDSPRLYAPIVTEYIGTTPLKLPDGIGRDPNNHSVGIETSYSITGATSRLFEGHFIAEGIREGFIAEGIREDFDVRLPTGKDPLQVHLRECANLEKLLGNVTFETTPRPFRHRLWHLVTITASPADGSTRLSLETRLRAPKNFLPDGFMIEGQPFSDLIIISEYQGSHLQQSSNVMTPNLNLELPPIDFPGIAHLPLSALHAQRIGQILEWTGQHYENKTGDNPLKFYDSGFLSYVDHWDLTERIFNKSARTVAKLILEKSLLRGIIRGVILYGSLARRDKSPGDVDLLLIVDSEQQLDPRKYYLDGKRRSPSGDEAVTRGLAKELGIFGQLVTLGRESGTGLPHGYGFAPFGGHLNLSAIPIAFFANPELREQLMRGAYTPTYYREVLTDGLQFNRQSRKFDLPTRQQYAATIAALEDQLKQGREAGWPNITNVREKK